jgi:hypothetical protein
VRCEEVTMQGLSRVQPTVRSTGLKCPSQVFKFKINSFIFFQRMHISPNKNFYSDIQCKFSQIFWEHRSPTILTDKPPLVLVLLLFRAGG